MHIGSHSSSYEDDGTVDESVRTAPCRSDRSRSCLEEIQMIHPHCVTTKFSTSSVYPGIQTSSHPPMLPLQVVPSHHTSFCAYCLCFSSGLYTLTFTQRYTPFEDWNSLRKTTWECLDSGRYYISWSPISFSFPGVSSWLESTLVCFCGLRPRPWRFLPTRYC